MLKALLDHKLLKGRHLGSRQLHHRSQRQSPRTAASQHRGGLLELREETRAEAGIDPDDTKAVRRFDKKREGRKTSNEDWVNPHDPEAKVGGPRTALATWSTSPSTSPTSIPVRSSGRKCVREDAGDSEGLCERVMKGCETLARVCEDPKQEKVAESLTTDEGYFSLEEVCGVQCEGIRTIMGDPHASKRQEGKLCKVGRQTLRKARVAVQSKSGKALLRKRGEHLERSFAHVLDQGGMRRATLRGTENLTKRLTAAALAYNLTLLMRKLFGFGTPKQWAAKATFFGLLACENRPGSHTRPCQGDWCQLRKNGRRVPEPA